MLASSGSDGALKIWESESGTELRSLAAPAEQGWYSSVAFSPDGSLLATGTIGGQVELYNPETGEQLSSVQLNSGGVLALAFRLDGQQLAASTRDGGVWLLDRTS
jgi:WD40 repeat protein